MRSSEGLEDTDARLDEARSSAPMLTSAVRRLRHVIDAVMCRVWNLMCRPWLRVQGVQLGVGVQFYGAPVVSMAPGSVIALGDRVSLCSSSHYTALGVSRPVVLRTLRPDARIQIGANSGLSGTVVCAAVAVTVGEDCLFGADVKLMDTDFHPIAARGRRHNNRAHDIASASIRIGRNVFLGTGTMVLKGVSIGDNAVIGAGSVVVHDVPANAIACGNPARVVGAVPMAAEEAPE